MAEVKALGITIGDGPGSPEFKRQAAEWAKWSRAQGHEVTLSVLDVAARPLSKRYPAVERAVQDTGGGLRQVAIFCHGWSKGLQLVPGPRVAGFAALVRLHELAPGSIVTLYACSAADGPAIGGDGGFADRLRDALCAVGDVHCRVDAHQTPGHTTRNPYVRRFEGGGSLVGGKGGEYIVEPKSSLWRAWVAALKGDLRWRFPSMTVAEIRASLPPP